MMNISPIPALQQLHLSIHLLCFGSLICQFLLSQSQVRRQLFLHLRQSCSLLLVGLDILLALREKRFQSLNFLFNRSRWFSFLLFIPYFYQLLSTFLMFGIKFYRN